MVRSPSAASNPPRAPFQSQPTDLDLVNTYLRPWVEQGVKTGPFIHDADVYAIDPADLTQEFTPAVAQDGEKAWYFYTALRHKSVRGKRKARTVATGSGCWHNEAKPKPVYSGINGKRQIGYRQSFSFVKKHGSLRVRTGWLMIELRLLKDSACAEKELQEEGALTNLALCKVYRSPRNPEPKNGEPAAAAAAAAAGQKAKSLVTEADDGDRDDASPRSKSDQESSEATVAAPSRYSKAVEEEISGTAAATAGRIEEASIRDDSDEASAAAPAAMRKLSEEESSGAAAPAAKRKVSEDESSRAAAPAAKRKLSEHESPGAAAARANGSTSPVAVAPTPASEMHCPSCGAHFVVTLKKPDTETEVAKEAPRAPEAAPQMQFHQWL